MPLDTNITNETALIGQGEFGQKLLNHIEKKGKKDKKGKTRGISDLDLKHGVIFDEDLTKLSSFGNSS